MKLAAFLLTLAVTITATIAVEFDAANNAPNTPGGDRFDQQIGIGYSEQVMSDSSDFIWTTFQQAPADRKNVNQVTLSIESLNNNNVVAETANNVIHYNVDYIASDNGDIKTDFAGVIYHEMTHVWQWNALGTAPSGLIEGIADFVRLKANYKASNWKQPGEGDHWDEGYDVTAYFLDYCNGLLDGFVAQLNAKMKDSSYTDDFFVELLGKTVDQLWSDYKAMYGN